MIRSRRFRRRLAAWVSHQTTRWLAPRSTRSCAGAGVIAAGTVAGWWSSSSSCPPFLALQSCLFKPVPAKAHPATFLSHDFESMAECIRRGSLRDLKRLVRRSGNLEPASIKNEYGRTLIMIAAKGNRVKILDYLLRQARAEDINARENNTGLTALHYACWKGSVGAARALLTAGADPTIYDMYGIAPVHKAVAFNQLQILRIIFEMTVTDLPRTERAQKRQQMANFKTGEVTCPPEYHAKALIDTPYHIAARSGNVGIMELLARYGAHPVVQNREGDTPLHCAVRQKRLPAVELLLREQKEWTGSMLRLKNLQGRLPGDACNSLDLDCVAARAKVKLAKLSN
mmetsp:Transcript_4751/g.11207  ORF Transcript_4751/g.11207 Transcript_4751/m.11207 type:complete len:343 (+) Transcript_4751:1-1029(+)